MSWIVSVSVVVHGIFVGKESIKLNIWLGMWRIQKKNLNAFHCIEWDKPHYQCGYRFDSMYLIFVSVRMGLSMWAFIAFVKITSFLISHFPRFVVQRAVMVWTCDRDFDTDAACLLCILAVIVGNCSLRCVSSFHFISVTVPCFLVVMCTWRSSSSSSLRRCCRCAVDLIHAACLNVWLFALYIRLYRLVFSWA